MRSQTHVSVRDNPPLTIIDLEGEVTTFSEDPIVAAYRQASDNGARDILLNFRDVDYINSAGIAVIIGLMSEARQKDQTILVTGLTAHYTKVFQIMGLDQYVPIFDTEADAQHAVANDILAGRD